MLMTNLREEKVILGEMINISHTYKALVEMRLNGQVWNFIKVILDPTDSSNMSMLASGGFSRQRITREWWQ